MPPHGQPRIETIKTVSYYCGVGLKEAKEIVDAVDVTPQSLTLKTANDLGEALAAFSELGCEVKEGWV